MLDDYFMKMYGYGYQGPTVNVKVGYMPAQQRCIFCENKYGTLADATNNDIPIPGGGIIMKIVCAVCVQEKMLESIPIEFLDVSLVLGAGSEKHGKNNWLKKNGNTADHKSMHSSMFRHLASSYAGQRIDPDSGLPHLLHLSARSSMAYTLHKRGIVHELDEKY